MSDRNRKGLIALNVALLGVLALVSLAPTAGGEQQANRGRGDYTMIGAQYQGGNTNAIVILDAMNRELIALRWDNSRRTLEGMGYRDLATDADAAPADRGR